MNSLDPDRWKQVKSLFEAALERGAAERGAFLKERCADDPDLLEEVRSLLEAHGGEGPIDRAMDRISASLHRRPTEAIDGRRIGPYELVEELGRGGMGRVFRAERADGQFDQEVALKWLGLALPSREATKRFLAERQILAKLSHPHIARLLDGGVTKAGEPYFVMELVEGEPIDTYCTDHRLSIQARLRLMLDVCDAVQYAHQNLVAHRDLKPSNILVTGDEVVKLLDFGIAKLLDPEAMHHVSRPSTRTGWLPMTPEYASPEQVRGGKVTAASDVYQLGIVLYELLTDRRPHAVADQTPSDLEHLICETDPPRPSTALDQQSDSARTDPSIEQVSRRRQTSAQELRGALRGDLDAIVMKALRKEPKRRYDSVEQLAEDLRRVLEDRPVSAYPNRWTYRAEKFARRHRSGIAAAVVILLLLIGYGATITWYSRRTQAALNRAQQEAQKSEQVTDFLIGMFERVDPYQGTEPAARLGDTLTARQLLDQGATKAREELSNQPVLKANMLHTLGRIHRQLGYHDQAASLLEDALALQKKHLSNAHIDRARSLYERALLFRYEGEMQQATRMYRQALSIQRNQLDGEHSDIADTIRELGIIAAREGRYPQADSLFREALAMRKSLHGPNHPAVASDLHVLGLLYVLKQEIVEAERLLRRSLRIRRRHADDEHPLLAETLDRLGQVLVKQNELSEAQPLLRQALQIREELFPKVHPSRAASLNNLGRLMQNKGEYARADTLHRKAQSIYQQLYGTANLDAANTLYERGKVHRAQDHYTKAEHFYSRAAAMQQSIHGPDHPATRRSREALVDLYRKWDKTEKLDSLQSLLAVGSSDLE